MPFSDNVLGPITVAAVLAAYVSGVWGIYRHFLVKDKVQPEMKLTSALSLLGLVWFLVERWLHGAMTASVSPASDCTTIALLAGFMVLFWWTVAYTRSRRLTLAFSTDQPEFIYTTGPYSLVRHPFYASYLIFWIAVALGSGTWSFWLMPITMAVIYYRAIRFEEAKFAASSVSSEYAKYTPYAGRLLASLWARPKSSGVP